MQARRVTSGTFPQVTTLFGATSVADAGFLYGTHQRGNSDLAIVKNTKKTTSIRAPAPNTGSMTELNEASDAQLVTLIARFSEVALAEVYRRHGGAVYGLARKVLNNQAEAEDVAQEVFLRLWNQPERFDPSRGNLRSFLLTQSHARAVDTIRSLTSARRREIADAASTAGGRYDVHREAWDVMVSEEVLRALRGLPEEERRAIELAYFEGHTYVQVAQILDVPEGTIKGRIRNGMRRMRGDLSRQGIQGADR
jgi:RNA polymerase sigma-70 factor, ECF subfamily